MDDFAIYSAMNTGEPVASYKKACVGRLNVVVLNPFSKQREDIIVSGDPFNPSVDINDIVIDLWDDMQLAFFKKMNKPHIEAGFLVPFDRSKAKKDEKAQKNYNIISDEEISKVLLEPFYSLKNILVKITSSATLFRILSMARELEKSEKIIKNIEERIAEIQSKE